MPICIVRSYNNMLLQIILITFLIVDMYISANNK